MNTIAMLSQLRKKTLQHQAPGTGKRNFFISLAVLVALSFTVVTPPRVLAQAQNTGSIYGSAVDPSGAVIANATVSAVSATTGAERDGTTNKNGEYTLQNLAVGTYTLTVTAPGFESYVVDHITVDADSNTKIVAKLTIGSKNEVTVQSESSAVDARSATLGTLIDNNLVEDLPIDGRNVVAMAGLLPGVTDVNAPTSATGDTSGPTYAVSGSRSTQNLMLFDGLMWNNLFFNTGVNYPAPNALQEISVLLNNYKAQYGRNSGSVFNVITKSGTNTIHGSIWDYFHNQMFDAQDYIFPLPSGKAPEDNINQFGATIGGPIIHDKMFFFGAIQELITHVQKVAVATGAQGFAERGFLPGSPNVGSAISAAPLYDRPCTSPGPFAGLTCANFASDVTTQQTATNGTVVNILGKFTNPSQVTPSGQGADPSIAKGMLDTAYAALHGPGTTSPCWDELNTTASIWAATHYYMSDTPVVPGGPPALPPGITPDKAQPTYLPNAEFPTNCLNPVFGAILAKYVPLPTVVRQGKASSVTTAPQPKHDMNALIRLDWMVNAKHTLDVRYNLIRGDDLTAAGVNSASVGIANYEPDYNTVLLNFGNIGDTWVVTPNMVNVLRLGYKRYENFVNPTDPSTLSTFNTAGGPAGNLIEPGPPVLPAISISGNYTLGAAGAGGGIANQAFSDHVNEDIEVLEQLTWSHGKHNFQFGANFLRLQYNNNQDYPGSLSFSTAFTGLSAGDASLGMPANVQANSPLQQGGIQHDVFVYAQDDWRFTSRLTLNLGLRYELPFQWYQPSGYSSTFIPGHQSTVFPGAVGGLAFPGDPGVRSSLVPTDFNGLVPRIGFAYDVFGTGKFAIRGGFGMFFDAINANVIGVGEPFYFQYFQLFPQGGLTDPLLLQAGTNQREMLPSGYSKASPQFQAPYSLFYPDRNFRTPYVEAINFGFQYKIPHGGTLEVNYVGKFARKLTVPFDQNPAITDCTGGYYAANPTVYGNASCAMLTGIAGAGGQATSSPSSTKQRLRYTQFNYGGGGLVDFASVGTGSYNGLQMQYTQRGGKRLTMLASYTYSKSIDLQSDGTVSAGQASSIPNPFNISSERGLSDTDSRHIFNMGWTYNLPKLRYGWAAVRAITNNWNFSGVYSAHTGQPFSVLINNDTALDAEKNQRAEIVPGMNPRLPNNRHRADKVKEWFNVQAFTYPVTGTFSKVPRNYMTGPAYINTNFSAGRYFPMDNLRQGMKLYFRAEALNVFNTPNLAKAPSATFSCSNSAISNTSAGLQPCTGTTSGTPNVISQGGTFGQILSTAGTNGTTSSNGRKMQFSLTLYY